jgi:hypothetical protein
MKDQMPIRQKKNEDQDIRGVSKRIKRRANLLKTRLFKAHQP